MWSFIKRSDCGTSQFTGSSGPVRYTLHVFYGVKLVFHLSLSLPRKIIMITFMHCKVVELYDQGGLGSESVVGLGLACGLVLRLGIVSGLYKWLFYLATVR